jgi:hypothetical protein
MWKLIEVALAPPLIVFVVAKTCLMSKVKIPFAGTTTADAKATSSKDKVKVPSVAAVFVTMTLVIIVVVEDGTV